jgi:hypothetical protein
VCVYVFSDWNACRLQEDEPGLVQGERCPECALVGDESGDADADGILAMARKGMEVRVGSADWTRLRALVRDLPER